MINISKFKVIIKPGKTINFIIDNIEYDVYIEENTYNHHTLHIHDITNDTHYQSNGTSVINLKVFESKPVSKFDSTKHSLYRTKNIELEVI